MYFLSLIIKAKGGKIMKQVKVFDCSTVGKLEDEMNDFLSSQGSKFELIDIKFNSYSYGEDGSDYHSAMIIYENK
jgi:hypothetical protein